MRRSHLAILVLLAALVVPATCVASGGPPVPYADQGVGIVARDDGSRYYTALGREANTVVRLDRASEQITTRDLPGHFVLPGVAMDGTPGGLSADGDALVLVDQSNSFVRRGGESRFVVLGTRRLRLRHEITLRGPWGFDASSPDGLALYLVRYLDAGRTSYEVRAYDVERGRLEPEPVLESEVATVTMRGLPLSRVTSPDGRWEYTLYDGAGKTPFVHALDTLEGVPVCIEIGETARPIDRRSSLQMIDEGSSLLITHPKQPLATIDTSTWEVTLVAGGEPSSASGAEGTGSAFHLPWLATPASLLVFGGLGLLRTRRRRTGRQPGTA